MDLCLYTDSVADLSFEAALDLAARIGCGSIEIAGGGQSSAPHLRLGELLGDRRKRTAFADAFAMRGLRIAALNCSAWPLHPVHGPAQEAIIRDTIRLAGELGVETVVSMSGTPGDGAGASTVDWVFYPWPSDAVALLTRQWEVAIPFWQEMAAYATANGVKHIAFELHPLHLVFNVPTLLRMRAGGRPDHRREHGSLSPLLAADGPAGRDRGARPGDPARPPQGHGAPGRQGRAGRRPRHDALRGRTRARLDVPNGRPRPRPGLVGLLRAALRAVGYDGVLSIENEDPYQSKLEGVEEAAAFMRPLIG